MFKNVTIKFEFKCTFLLQNGYIRACHWGKCHSKFNQPLKGSKMEKEEIQAIKMNELRNLWSTHAFVMMRLNDPNDERSLYVIEGKRCEMNEAIKKIRTKHPHSIMIYQCDSPMK
jgi:hypothetical protein